MFQDTGEECADTGVVDTTSLSLRMPLNRGCDYWVAALRFPDVYLPPAAVIDEAYVIFPVHALSAQTTPVSLRIFVEGVDSALPLTQTASGITGRPSLNAVVSWTPDSWPADSSSAVQMSADIGGSDATLISTLARDVPDVAFSTGTSSTRRPDLEHDQQIHENGWK